MGSLANKRILLGVTGGIAAYKSADLVRRLQDAGAAVRVAMTPAATEFIAPLTFQALSGNPVHCDLLDPQAEAAMGHIELARWADLVIIAPATADFIAKLASGAADNLLLAVCLATPAPIALAPAMNQGMWHKDSTADNLALLRARGVAVLGPDAGSQACGDIGPGRMLEPLAIVTALAPLLKSGLLSGRKVVITAGPTREAIDPVRYISNHSSGKMGYALAAACAEAGAETWLISGPTALPTPDRVNRVDVVSARDMLAATLDAMAGCDLFIGAAAVADDTAPLDFAALVALHRRRRGRLQANPRRGPENQEARRHHAPDTGKKSGHHRRRGRPSCPAAHRGVRRRDPGTGGTRPQQAARQGP